MTSTIASASAYTLDSACVGSAYLAMATPRTGTLTIAGSGVAFIGHITLETLPCIQASGKPFWKNWREFLRITENLVSLENFGELHRPSHKANVITSER